MPHKHTRPKTGFSRAPEALNGSRPADVLCMTRGYLLCCMIRAWPLA
jgi:hypothetical protein